MGDGHPEREVVTPCVPQRHAAQLHIDVLVLDAAPPEDAAGFALCSGRLVETEAREGRALRARRMGA